MQKILLLRDDLYTAVKPISDVVYEPMEWLSVTFDMELDYVVYFTAIIFSFITCLILG